MKIKSHSGTKKRIKVRGKKKLFLQKAGKQHLLTNKSKKQKASAPHGVPAPRTHVQDLRRLISL